MSIIEKVFHNEESEITVIKCRDEIWFRGKGSVIFYQEGGLLKIGGDQVLCLRSKGGIKRFFKLKRGDHLYFLKK